jgi:hypothetical protein
MREKIFSKKELIIMAIILLAAVFSFVWFELRPYFAKRECVKTAEKFINTSSGQSFQEKYDFCLLLKGYK